MGETYTQMLNRNFRAAYGDENASRNSTCKYFAQGTNELMPKVRGEPDLNGDTLYNHNGRDLTEVFQTEIMEFDTPWNWIQDRIDNENFTGLMIGDYVPLKIHEKDWIAIIIGINTYKGQGPTETRVDTHIDFWLTSDEDENTHDMNKVNNNNSLEANVPYWPITDMYFWLNALEGSTPNSTSTDRATTDVDYSENGFLLDLPESLQALLVEKYCSMPARYNSNSLATSDNQNAWGSAGKLWLLDNVEITGMAYSGLYLARGSVQYPFFTNNLNRQRKVQYWLSNAYTNNSGFTAVTDNGLMLGYNASGVKSAFPGFRLMKTPEPATP